jgi:SAM-dependent methyltransferase
MQGLKRLQQNWEGLARVDPMWAICVDHGRLGNKWTIEEFFETGEVEIQRIMEYLGSLGLSPERAGAALDFGCGVGRLTSALGRRFQECWGVDISPTMIRLAEQFNKDSLTCHFRLNPRDNLQIFPDERFTFVYTSLVLQHIQRKYVEGYLRELIRVLKPGGVFVFQVPERERAPVIAKLRNRVGFRRRLYRALGRQAVDRFHMEMHCLAEGRIRALLSDGSVRIVDVRLTNSSTAGFCGNLRFLEREPDEGYTSKQYCVVKTPKDGSTGASRRAGVPKENMI